MKFSSDFLNILRSRVKISSIIGSRIIFDNKVSNTLRGDFWAHCPFHKEKTPSFHCNDERGKYHCFGCGESGDHFLFLKKFDGITFYDAVVKISEIAGISINFYKTENYTQKNQNIKLYHIMKLATSFFEKNLKENEGAQAYEYLKIRKISPNIQTIFHLGYSTCKKTQLRDFLVSQGIKNEDIISSGLLIINNNSMINSYDRFRNRIIFPIEDIHGNIIGFGGRTLYPHASLKYINSPETQIFQKRNILYNISRVKNISTNLQNSESIMERLIVVEGYMDVVSLVSFGFRKTIASLGTMLTKMQIDILWKISKNPIFCFDGDQAGIYASFRVVEQTLSSIDIDTSLSFVILPKDRDPSEILQKEGIEYFKKFLESSISFSEMLWKKETYNQVFSTPESLAKLEIKLTRSISLIKDHKLRYYFFQDMKNRINSLVKISKISSFNFKKKNNDDQNFFKKQNTISKNLIYSELIQNKGKYFLLREAMIIAFLVKYPVLISENFKIISSFQFRNNELYKLYLIILSLESFHSINTDEIIKILEKKNQYFLLKRVMKFVFNTGIRCIISESPIEEVRKIFKEVIAFHMHSQYVRNKLDSKV